MVVLPSPWADGSPACCLQRSDRPTFIQTTQPRMQLYPENEDMCPPERGAGARGMLGGSSPLHPLGKCVSKMIIENQGKSMLNIELER